MIAFVGAFFLLVACVALQIGFGTFVVDPLTLVVPGYVVTYLIYSKLPDYFRRGGWAKFWILTFPGTLIALSIGAWLPYFNIVPSGSVYGGLLPQSFVGPVQGNDFMWNGLGLMNGFWIFPGFGRVVPESLTPTYQYFWFNVLAFVIWASYPLCLGYGVLVGQHTALRRKSNKWAFVRRLIAIILIGIGLSVLNAALAALVSAYYLQY
ncbi:MAG: hypothetical protein Q7S28_04250 [bacterium]|nr:hypothetical protein [bacterium]